MNIAQGLAHAKKVYGNREAVTCGNIRYNWKEFDRRTDYLARGLASLGIHAATVSAGKEVVGVEVRVVNAEGEDVQPDEVGEVIARGPNIMMGYWHMPEATAAAVVDGWMHTGDLATVDEENYIFIIDRIKDMIISGGENIYSVEVENALYTHPAVLEAAVIGISDPAWGESVHAVVVLKPGTSASEDDLIAHTRGLIAGYKVPRSIEIVTDALPKSGAGKILKRTLRDKYWSDKSRNVN